jgi:SPP1 gp7 family putative phage head morphogenesis protein
MAPLSKFERERVDANDARIGAVERALANRYRLAFQRISADLARVYAEMGAEPSLVEARRAGRLGAVLDTIRAEYQKITGEARGMAIDAVTTAYREAYYGTAWAVDQATGIEVRWPELADKAVQAVAVVRIGGKTFEDRLVNWGSEGARRVANEVTAGLAAGQGYKKVARRLQAQLGASAYQAQRIVRTESTRAYTEGHLATYDEAEAQGVKLKRRWVATLDERTREIHGALDGEYADDDGYFRADGASTLGPGGFGDPALDCNCRCAVEAEVEGFGPEFRRYDDKISPYISYSEWSANR